MSSDRRGFTLLEIAMVIAIVAVISVAVLITLNPAQLLKQGRDARRLADIAVLNKALSIYQAQAASSSLGVTTTLFVSIPDTSTSCSNTGLSGTVACASTTTLTKADGTGWVPINFLTIAGVQAPINSLPIDPVNSTSTGLYYAFQLGSGGTWKISAGVESNKYLATAGGDGGADPIRLERGSDISLTAPSGVAIGTPILWLKGDGITGLNNNDQISTWVDSSGTGNDATGQNQSGSKPVYKTGMINGLPAAYFATNGYFALPDLLNGKTSAEIFYVIKIPVDGQYNAFSAFGNSGQNSHYGYLGSVYDDFGSNNRWNPGDYTGLLSDWHVYNVSASTTWTAYQDGTQVYTTGGNTFAYTNTPKIGRSDPAGVLFDGYIAEVIVYGTTLSTTTRATVTTYLRNKYGL